LVPFVSPVTSTCRGCGLGIPPNASLTKNYVVLVVVRWSLGWRVFQKVARSNPKPCTPLVHFLVISLLTPFPVGFFRPLLAPSASLQSLDRPYPNSFSISIIAVLPPPPGSSGLLIPVVWTKAPCLPPPLPAEACNAEFLDLFSASPIARASCYLVAPSLVVQQVGGSPFRAG